MYEQLGQEMRGLRVRVRETNMPDEREAFQIQEDVRPSCKEEGVLPGYRVEDDRCVHCALSMAIVAMCAR